MYLIAFSKEIKKFRVLSPFCRTILLPLNDSCFFLFRLSLWIKGQAQLSQRDYMSSIATLSSLDNQSYLRDNTQLLNSLAEAKFCDGQYTQALALFQRVRPRLLDICLYIKQSIWSCVP